MHSSKLDCFQYGFFQYGFLGTWYPYRNLYGFFSKLDYTFMDFCKKKFKKNKNFLLKNFLGYVIFIVIGFFSFNIKL